MWTARINTYPSAYLEAFTYTVYNIVRTPFAESSDQQFLESSIEVLTSHVHQLNIITLSIYIKYHSRFKIKNVVQNQFDISENSKCISPFHFLFNSHLGSTPNLDGHVIKRKK
jgi:hypothetical protein